MEKVINNLKEKSILHRNQVMNIKKYIDDKYKDQEASRKAVVFANAVHNIVDQSVKKFEKQHRIQIRTEVLKSAIAKDIFDINGYDVFEVCSLLPIEDNAKVKEAFFSNLTEWINENQEIQISKEETLSLATQIIDSAVSAVVTLLEASVLIDPDIKDYIVDNPELEEHISDGRFMDTEGDIIELTSAEIEKALREDDILEETINELKMKAQNVAKSLKEEEAIVNQVMDAISVRGNQENVKQETLEIKKGLEDHEVLANQESEDDVFDSMDYLSEDDDWTETSVVIEKKVETTRLGGYELNPPIIEPKEPGLTLKIKLLIIVPAVLVALALIILLIIGALKVSQKSALIEDEDILANNAQSQVMEMNLKDEESNSYNNIEESLEKIEGVNYDEGGHLAEILK